MNAPARWYDHRADDVDRVQLLAWQTIREAALDALDDRTPWSGRYVDRTTDTPGAYRIHTRGRTHDVRSMDDLARVTRAERQRDGVRWPEDG